MPNHFLHRVGLKLSQPFFKPKELQFWRTLIVCFCLCCLLGHFMEMAYCGAMDSLFGIVEDDYAVKVDPWFVPYWVYGFGALGMTVFLEPFKQHILSKRKTIWGALLEMFAIAVFLSMVMELGFGLLINQPDATGHYPYWDNSQLPLNVFQQAWLVNDVFIGLAGMAYLWLIFPLVSIGLNKLDEVRRRAASKLSFATVYSFGLCCAASYLPMVM